MVRKEDRPEDKRPSTRGVIAADTDKIEWTMPIEPGIYRARGEQLVLTLYENGTLCAYIYEDWFENDDQFGD